MFANDNEAKSAFDKLLIAHSLNAPTPLNNHLQLYQEILDCFPEGALKKLFIHYSGYEPSESMAKDWWNFYCFMLAERKCRRPYMLYDGHAVIFMWATRATHRMESDR